MSVSIKSFEKIEGLYGPIYWSKSLGKFLTLEQVKFIIRKSKRG